jgi:hypothetical protein
VDAEERDKEEREYKRGREEEEDLCRKIKL